MNEQKEDIFDLMMHLPGLKVFSPLYKKYREALLYLFFGGLTFFIGIGIYVWMNTHLGINALIANIVSWIAGVTFSFFTTKRWVFRFKSKGIKTLFQQIFNFYTARLTTLGLQELLLYIFINLLGYGSTLTKICTEIINIILNYLVSKFIIFKK